MDPNELGGPLPHIVPGLDAINPRHDRAHIESVVLEPTRQLPASVGLAPGFAPGCHYMIAKFLVAWTRWNELLGIVIAVVMKNGATAGPQRVRDFFHDKVWVGNKTKDPAAPAEVERAAGQIVLHEIELVNFDVR